MAVYLSLGKYKLLLFPQPLIYHHNILYAEIQIRDKVGLKFLNIFHFYQLI